MCLEGTALRARPAGTRPAARLCMFACVLAQLKALTVADSPLSARRRPGSAAVEQTVTPDSTCPSLRSERRPRNGVSRKNGALSGCRDRPPTGGRPPSLTPRPRFRAGPGQGTHCALSCTNAFCLDMQFSRRTFLALSVAFCDPVRSACSSTLCLARPDQGFDPGKAAPRTHFSEMCARRCAADTISAAALGPACGQSRAAHTHWHPPLPGACTHPACRSRLLAPCAGSAANLLCAARLLLPRLDGAMPTTSAPWPRRWPPHLTRPSPHLLTGLGRRQGD